MSISSFFGHQLSHYGRAGRLEFFSYFLVGLLTLVITFAPFVWFSWEYINASIDYGPDVALMMSEDDEFTFFGTWFFYIWGALAYIWGMVLSVATMMTTCRRLTDIGWSKWLWLLVFVPLVNIVLFILLCVLPSKKESLPEV